jgi:hypothetical protein
MRKKRSIAKSRAASLKVHRTIARMKEARQYDRQVAEAFIALMKHPAKNPYRHVLPNPWLELK